MTQKGNKKIIITSGYFNPLHIGHINLFKEAKKLGDYLIVVVNNEEQVKLKGSINFMPEQERVEIIKAIGCVDEVFLSIDKDGSVKKSLESIFQKYQGNELIFAKGGDSTTFNVPEIEICKNFNAKVILDVGGKKVQSSSWLLAKNIEIKNKDMDIDIVDFLKSGKGFHVGVLKLWPPLKTRAIAFRAMLKGDFSFLEFCQFSTPYSWGYKFNLLDRYHAFISKDMEQTTPFFSNKFVKFFGQKFYSLNNYELLEIVNEVVILDQYNAKKFLKKNSIVIDAGANFGIFSIFATKLSPAGKIYAFEPVGEVFEMLKKNTEYYPEIECINLGLGDKNSQKKIFISSGNLGASTMEDSSSFRKELNEKENRKSELVKITTIDDFVFGQNIPRVDFIKIDTEGYEAKILKGAEKTIRRDNPVISMSAYHNKNDKNDLPKIVKQFSDKYICELHKDYEADLVCYVPNN